MNIFVLDRDPIKCVESMFDSHVVKMPIEYCQMLSTTFRLLTNNFKYGPEYKITHKNHPSTIWVRESKAHFEYLYGLSMALMFEFKHRYGKFHKSSLISRDIITPANFPADIWLRDPPQAMPDEYKSDDVVSAYRNYYINGKSHLAKWRNRTKPEWYV